MFGWDSGWELPMPCPSNLPASAYFYRCSSCLGLLSRHLRHCRLERYWLKQAPTRPSLPKTNTRTARECFAVPMPLAVASLPPIGIAPACRINYIAIALAAYRGGGLTGIRSLAYKADRTGRGCRNGVSAPEFFPSFIALFRLLSRPPSTVSCTLGAPRQKHIYRPGSIIHTLL